MVRGRRPLPSAVKRLRGNPGKRPLNRYEPRAPRGYPNCPRWIKGEARAEWRRVARPLYEAGILTDLDRAVLAAYCVCYGRWAAAERVVADRGFVLKTADGGFVQNPYLAVANRAMAELRRLAEELGMTPSSRSRVTVAAGHPELTLADVLFREATRPGDNGN